VDTRLPHGAEQDRPLGSGEGPDAGRRNRPLFGDLQAAVLGGPAAGSQLLEQRPVEPARRAIMTPSMTALALPQRGIKEGREI
jgi:hypothetical protein